MILHDVFIGTLYVLGTAGAVMLVLFSCAVIKGAVRELRKRDD